MAENKKLSVEEMLAAARASATKAAQPSAAAPQAPAPAPAPKGEAVKPAPKPDAGGSRPDVAAILAAARSGGKPASPGGAPASPAATPVSAKAPAAKSVTVEAPAEATKAGPRDTGSILGAARSEKRPGPMSKSEAAAAGIEASPKAKLSPPPMPAKPAFLQPKPAPAVDEERRGVLGFLSSIAVAATNSLLGVGFTALSATGGLWTLGGARFMFPNILTEPPSKFKVGFPSDFPPGQVQTKFVSQYGVWVVNGEYAGQRQIYALKTVCTHLGCTPNWLEGEQKFKCPCHGSGFYKDGINFEGPAPRPLERYSIRLADDGQIEIDKSKKFQEEMGQWADSSSFVSVV